MSSVVGIGLLLLVVVASQSDCHPMRFKHEFANRGVDRHSVDLNPDDSHADKTIAVGPKNSRTHSMSPSRRLKVSGPITTTPKPYWSRYSNKSKHDYHNGYYDYPSSGYSDHDGYNHGHYDFPSSGYSDHDGYNHGHDHKMHYDKYGSNDHYHHDPNGHNYNGDSYQNRYKKNYKDSHHNGPNYDNRDYMSPYYKDYSSYDHPSYGGHNYHDHKYDNSPYYHDGPTPYDNPYLRGDFEDPDREYKPYNCSENKSMDIDDFPEESIENPSEESGAIPITVLLKTSLRSPTEPDSAKVKIDQLTKSILEELVSLVEGQVAEDSSTTTTTTTTTPASNNQGMNPVIEAIRRGDFVKNDRIYLPETHSTTQPLNDNSTPQTSSIENTTSQDLFWVES